MIGPDDRKARANAFQPIRNRIADHFGARGMSTHVIFRTVQTGFGAESPHNLIPKDRKPGRVKVFVDFRDSRIDLDNIRRVICIPDTAAGKLPMLARPRLGPPKVDLARLPVEYVFADLDDLLRRG